MWLCASGADGINIGIHAAIISSSGRPNTSASEQIINFFILLSADGSGRRGVEFPTCTKPWTLAASGDKLLILTVDKKTAKRIGRRIAIKSGLIGLLIAYLLFALMMLSWDTNYIKALFWIVEVEFKFHLFVGAVGLLSMAYLFGQLAGVEILVKHRNYFLTGVKYGVLTLITGTLIGSSVGFLQEGIQNIGGFSNPFYDYYFKPLYWVTMYGIIPAIIVGLLFGHQIKRKGQKTIEKNASSQHVHLQ